MIKFTQSKLYIKQIWEASFPSFDTLCHVKLRHNSVKINVHTHAMHNEKHYTLHILTQVSQ